MKIAVAQLCPQVGPIESNAAKHHELIDLAVKQRVQLVSAVLDQVKRIGHGAPGQSHRISDACCEALTVWNLLLAICLRAKLPDPAGALQVRTRSNSC